MKRALLLMMASMVFSSCGEGFTEDESECEVAAEECAVGGSLKRCVSPMEECMYVVGSQRFYCESCDGADMGECLSRAMKACME